VVIFLFKVCILHSDKGIVENLEKSIKLLEIPKRNSRILHAQELLCGNFI
jgi:hypothetical protein